MDIEKPSIDKEESEVKADFDSFEEKLTASDREPHDSAKPTRQAQDSYSKSKNQHKIKEIGGFENRPEPTRFGDWEVNGRCSDF